MLVLGGGIGGLATALGLSMIGNEVKVLEQAPEFGEIGAGIQLGPNATRVLDRLGVLDAVVAEAVRPKELVYMDALSGERITSVDLGDPFIARFGYPYIVLHRTDLHRILLEACEAADLVELENDQTVKEVEESDEGVEALCADGSSHGASALVGADGLHSVARSGIHDDEPVATGYVAYRGALPVEEVSPHAGFDSVVMWVGPSLHLVQYKIRRGELFNQVGVFRSDRYGQSEDWGTPEELDQHFSRCCDDVSHGASKLSRAMRWPMADRNPIDDWCTGRVTLLGDAAHPMLQYMAQGGCQAIEDSLCLATCVGRQDNVSAAFREYTSYRIPRTTEVVLNSRRFGQFCHLAGVARDTRNALMAKRIPQDYDFIEWLYGAEASPWLKDVPVRASGAGPATNSRARAARSQATERNHG